MTRKQSSLQCSNSNAIRVAIGLLLLALALMPFFAMKHVQFEAHGFHPLNHHPEQPAKTHDVIQPVSCQDILNDPTIYDPNVDLEKDETKRLTITDPQFYISLHSQFFDKMRWVHIMKQGEYYEKGLTQLFHQILSTYDTTQQPLPLVLDIGMNIGWFSLYSRALGHDVAAFEPNPTMFLRVCESLEYNNWNQDNDNSIRLWNYGLGAQAGVLNLTLGKNPGGSSFHEDRLAPKFRKTIPVSVVKLDSIVIQQGWLDRKISLVKVDVEGFENFVFEGGKRLFYNGNVENILMENSINNITTVGQMVDMLYDAGYRVNEIRTINGDPYHEDWWHTFNPILEERHNAKVPAESDQIRFF
eukprot:CAMPEP_0172323192 /NCGR_PEP_ID=MMETSP1058-20130122/48103_1 /TAXON_ID=83371 /ORGANISM="Detonula confervacea, Strain CCMP 353" /LENGTH=356 /DNA_ID=CAMNT_0013039135 /DNA_START=200 /DNA_END=1267 /DNA_ORIENTATION=-